MEKPKRSLTELKDKILAGLQLSSQRLLERKKKENGEFVIFRDGRVMTVRAVDYRPKKG